MNRKAYTSDASDDECALVAPSPTLITEEAPQRVHRLREGCSGLPGRCERARHGE
jgi:hypothetical protein